MLSKRIRSPARGSGAAVRQRMAAASTTSISACSPQSTPSKTSTGKEPAHPSTFPDWAAPLASHLCALLTTADPSSSATQAPAATATARTDFTAKAQEAGKAAASHVLSGMAAITSSALEKDAQVELLRLPALAVVLSMLVTAKRTGRAVGQEGFVAQRTRAVRAAVEFLRENGSVERERSEEEEERMVEEVTVFVDAASRERWLGEPWFAAVETVGEDGPEEMEIDDDIRTEARGSDKAAGEQNIRSHKAKMTDKTPLRRKEKHAARPAARYEAEQEEDEHAAAGLKPGLATMFQDAVDWLAPWRQEGYRLWRQGMMDAIERATAQGGQGMRM